MKHLFISMAYGIAALLAIIFASFYLSQDISTNDTISKESYKTDFDTEHTI
ncbi:hypothetical protein [Costertonia aggregata]|uniref:Uncharacterized protein n=1 Tax=Costertonia aggregata TaxID=343403 RepID=A0A7H9AQB2_9FLAO|nr:hypothetical protein [Costertonia aggregata]QLG45638.1 hypothetical protein HYG79_09855 [Costertonia aggregata]